VRIVYLLLHDFRFASMGLKDFVSDRFHFSKEYAKRLAGLGHDVKLYVLTNENIPKTSIRMDGYELKALPTRFNFPPGLRFGNDHSLGALKELATDSPDVVHYHNYYLWNFPYLAVWTKMRGLKLVAQYHGTDPIRRLKGWAFNPSLRLCDRLLVPLDSEIQFLKSMKLPMSRILKFPSTGVDINVFHRTRGPDRPPSLLYVGRVPKDPDFRWERAPQLILPLLKAMRASGTEASLTVAGDGPGLPAMKQMAESLGVQDYVDFSGHLPNEALPELYSRAALTFVPIRLETIGPYWGGSVQESLACGTPVAGLNDQSPGIGRFGLLTPTDPGKAAKLVNKALADLRWSSSIEKAGPRAIADTCEWGMLARKLESVYTSISRPESSSGSS
jgi:glycosyltransferase involved in cell wall biosynthesis